MFSQLLQLIQVISHDLDIPSWYHLSVCGKHDERSSSIRHRANSKVDVKQRYSIDPCSKLR